MTRDYLSRVLCDSLSLRACTVISRNIVKEITDVHKTSPNAAYALGRTINAAALLSSTLKPDSDQNLTVKFMGSGPLREVQVQADARGNLRGYVLNPDVDFIQDLGGINFSRAIGAGFLIITKDMGLKEPYNSVMSLEKGEVAADVAYYLSVSEQVPSALILGLNIGFTGEILSSGGILIQSLPETTIETLEMVENNIHSMPRSLGDLLQDGEDIYNIVSRLMGNEPLSIMSTYELRHSCRCSSSMIESVIRNLDNKDIKGIIDEYKAMELTCTFCKKIYRFTEEDLKKLEISLD